MFCRDLACNVSTGAQIFCRGCLLEDPPFKHVVHLDDAHVGGVEVQRVLLDDLAFPRANGKLIEVLLERNTDRI